MRVGLQDTNLARVRATQTYLMRCDHVFIVANISRAITNQPLQSSLFDVLNRHVPVEWENFAGKRLKVSVVCTRSEVLRSTLDAKQSFTNYVQDLKLDTAKREFCGTGRRIAQSDMERLDRAILQAENDEDWNRKKDLKNEQVSSTEKLRVLTDKHIDDWYCLWPLEISMSKTACRERTPQKFPAADWKSSVCLIRPMKSIVKRVMLLWSRLAEYLNSVGFVIASPPMHSFLKRNISFDQNYPVSSTPLRSGHAVFLTFRKQAMILRRS